MTNVLIERRYTNQDDHSDSEDDLDVGNFGGAGSPLADNGIKY